MTMMAYAFLQGRRLAQAGRKKESPVHHLNPASQRVVGPYLTAYPARHRTIVLAAAAHSRESTSQFCQSSASRSEEHTSELQSLMRISYAVFCWKRKTNNI